jgi:hypothetical protein
MTGAALGIVAATLTWTVMAGRDSSPSIHVLPPASELGEVMQGQVVTGRVRVTNAGGARLSLTRVSTDCVTSVEIHGASELAPGAEREVTVRVNTATLPEGMTTRHVSFTSTDPRRPMVKIALRVVVKREISVVPRVVNLGTTRHGEGSTQELKLSLMPGVYVTQVYSTDRQVSAHVDDSADQTGATRVVLTRTASTKGWHSGVVVLQTSSEYMPEVRVPVRGSVD